MAHRYAVWRNPQGGVHGPANAACWAFVKEEEIFVPPMPPDAFVKVEYAVPRIPPVTAVKREHAVSSVSMISVKLQSRCSMAELFLRVCTHYTPTHSHAPWCEPYLLVSKLLSEFVLATEKRIP